MGLFSNFIFPDMGILNKPRQKEEYHFLLPNQGDEKRDGSFADPEEFKYSYRFVCFMDMLGCKKLVWESETSQDAFKQVKKISVLYLKRSKRNMLQITGAMTLLFQFQKMVI